MTSVLNLKDIGKTSNLERIHALHRRSSLPKMLLQRCKAKDPARSWMRGLFQSNISSNFRLGCSQKFWPTPTLTLWLDDPPIKYAQCHRPNWKAPCLGLPLWPISSSWIILMEYDGGHVNKQISELCGLPVRMTVTFVLLKALREKGYSCHGHTARSGTVAIASFAAVRGSLKIRVTSKSTLFWTLTDSASALGFWIMCLTCHDYKGFEIGPLEWQLQTSCSSPVHLAKSTYHANGRTDLNGCFKLWQCSQNTAVIWL